MLDENVQLSRLRIQNAKESLRVAESNFDNSFYKAAANRAYYAVFHAMRAVLALDGFDSKKHSGVIAQFRKEYIKTQKFDVKYSVTISDLFKSRTDCDYDDFFEVSKEDIERQLAQTTEFVAAVEGYLNSILPCS